MLQKLATKVWPWHRAKKSNPDSDEDGYLERCQWDIITKVDHASIIEIVRKAVHRQGHRNPAVQIYDTAQGTYHYVIKVKTFSSSSKKLMGWVVKIPGHGTPDRWTKEDEHMLKREAETLELLSEHTKVPSPEVIGYSATLDNEYGFPYIVMEELPGKPATDLWLEEHGECPSIETEQKRLVFLRSLARHMTELNNLSFKQIGIPMDPFSETGNFDDINPDQLPVSNYFVWPFCDSFDIVERGPFTSTQMYVKNSRDEDKLPFSKDDDKLTYGQLQKLGMHKILDMVLAHPVFTSAPSDTFALRHSDLDTQNILVDDAGNITGILDWDGSLAMPRCVGHSAVPHFLERDFYPDAADKSLFLSWRAGRYRSLYAAALVEAGNPDAKFTTKSHMYQALFSSLYEGANYFDVLIHLLREIPGLQMEIDHLFALVGKGCKYTELMLQNQLWNVLDPQLPAEGLLEQAENTLAMAAV